MKISFDKETMIEIVDHYLRTKHPTLEVNRVGSHTYSGVFEIEVIPAGRGKPTPPATPKPQRK